MPEQSDPTEVLGDIFADQLRAASDASEQFQSDVAKQNDQMRPIYASILEKLGSPRRGQPEQLPPDLQEIVSILSAQPRLIIPTKRYLLETVARINAAVDQIVGESEAPPPS